MTELSEEARAIPRVALSRVASLVRKDVDAAYAAAVDNPKNPQLIGDLGACYYVTHEPITAAECFGLAAKLDPSNLRWWYYRGLALLMAFDPPEATAALEKAVSVDPTYVPAFVQLGNALIDRDHAKARSTFERALKLRPNDAGALTGIGRCELKDGRKDRAIAILERVVQSDPGYNLARQALADAYEAAGKLGEAAEQRKSISAGEPPPLLGDPLLLELLEKSRNADFLIRLGRQLAETGRTDRAIALMRRAIETDASRTKAREHLGLALAMQGRYAEAAEQYRTVIQLDGSIYRAESNLGRIAVETGRYDDAIEHFKGVLVTQPNEPATLDSYALLLLALGRPKEASPLLERLVKVDSKNADARMSLVLGHVCEGRYDEAAREYRSALEYLPRRRGGPGLLVQKLASLVLNQYGASSRPDSPDRLTPKSVLMLSAAIRSKDLKEDAEAVLNYQDALADEAVQRAKRGLRSGLTECLRAMLPGDKTGILQGALAAVLGFQGRFDESAEAYRAAIAGLPDAYAAKVSLASLETRRDRLDDAEALYRQAIQQRPGDATAPLQFATLLLDKLRRPEAAESLMRETLRNHPDSNAAHFLLGRALADQGKTEDARNAWRRAIEIQPSAPEPYLALAETCLKANDPASALRLLHQGLNHAADSATLANGYAWLLATSSDSTIRQGLEAVRWARHACDLTGDRNPEFLDTLATAYGAAGQFDAAAESEKKAIAIAEKTTGSPGVEEFRKRLSLFESKQPYIQGR